MLVTEFLGGGDLRQALSGPNKHLYKWHDRCAQASCALLCFGLLLSRRWRSHQTLYDDC